MQYKKNTVLLAASLISAVFAITAFAMTNIWTDLDEDQNYTARHEMSFVQAGNRFYSFGGRENAQTLDTYDFTNDSWSTSSPAPLEFNHFQATEYEGLIWVIGGFENNDFPTESPQQDIYIYDPAIDFWTKGVEIPEDRRRGSGGLVEYQDKFYLVGGNTIGHRGGFVPWFDVYDPRTGEWTTLEDAPNPRDHFHATVADDKLYVAGGRLSGGVGGTFAPLINEVDVYDFATETWTTLPPSGDLPTPRAGTAAATFQNNVFILGGEGNGQAYDTVERLDPATNTWSAADSLNFRRHGTQAIVSGDGIFIIGGSRNQGGGNQRNMEAFNSTVPEGDENIRGVLVSRSNIFINNLNPFEFKMLHVSGNQGVIIESIEINGTNADLFQFTEEPNYPILVGVDDLFSIPFTVNSLADGAEANIMVTLAGGETQEVGLRIDINPPCPPDDPNQFMTSIRSLEIGCYIN